MHNLIAAIVGMLHTAVWQTHILQYGKVRVAIWHIQTAMLHTHLQYGTHILQRSKPQA